MSDLSNCVEAICQMMSKSFEARTDPRVFRQQVITRVQRLFEEGLSTQTVIALLIDRQHEKGEEKVLDQSKHEHLDLADFNVIEKKLGVNEQTAENRERWEARFNQKLAAYLCPHCGFAGNEFKDVSNIVGGSTYLQCPLCYQFEYVKFFTRDWTSDERAIFEQKREADRTAQAEARTKKAELDDRRKQLLDRVRADAATAVKAIDEFQWALNGEEPEEWTWDEESMDSEIRRVMGLILRPTFEGMLPIPQDEVVAYFKANLKPCDGEDGTLQQEFTRCAKQFTRETLKMLAGEDDYEN